MLTAIRSWRRGLARSLAKRIGEKLGEQDWRGGLARRRRWQGGGVGGEGRGGGVGADGSDKI